MSNGLFNALGGAIQQTKDALSEIVMPVMPEVQQSQTNGSNFFGASTETQLIHSPVVQATQTVQHICNGLCNATCDGDCRGKYDIEDTDVIRIEGVHKSFGNFKLFDDFKMIIPDFKGQGQFISILGKSGCGKSCTLDLISGLLKPDQGTIKIYGKPLKPFEAIPKVFQQYSAFPYMTVLENVALPLKMKGTPENERNEKAMEMIKLVGLDGKEHNWASRSNLSGGQLQRVSIARSLMAQEDRVLLLLDEPFSALDFIMREQMQETLLNLYNTSKMDPTIILVTHQIDEAVLLSNRIYIMAPNPGRVVKTLDIELGPNRTTAMKKSLKYLEYVSKVEDLMQF